MIERRGRHVYDRKVAAAGIGVNAVRPGFMPTGIHAGGGKPGRVDRIAPSLPMRRGGQPEAVTDAILWLRLVQAPYLTGTFIDLASRQ